jgi:hypothetical protein
MAPNTSQEEAEKSSKHVANTNFENRDSDSVGSHHSFVVADIDDDDSKSSYMIELSPSALRELPGNSQIVQHSLEHRTHVELLHILEQAEAPDYLFKQVLNWATKAKCMGYNFCPQSTSRSSVITEIETHFGLSQFKPTISNISLEGVVGCTPVVHFDFLKQLFSLLNDSSLMQPENLVLNPATLHDDGTVDPAPWFLPYNPADDNISEILSGAWYQETISLEENKNCFVCPIVMYVDKTFIDPMRSRFNLEPFNFTLGIFTRQCRSQFKFWRTLGYVPEQPATSTRNLAESYKPRNYHTMLRTILSGLISVHSNPELLRNVYVRIGNHVKMVTLRVPVAFIIADTQGADKLCGRYISYSDRVARIHRSCTCAPEDATNTRKKCQWVDMKKMMTLIQNNNKKELASISQHYIPNHAFREINFGANSHGIYAATPNDMLHGIKLGLISYMMEIFLEDDLNASAKHEVDKAVRNLLPHLRQKGNCNFPRMYFPNGITSPTNTTADEFLGFLFMSYLLTLTEYGNEALLHSPKMTGDRIQLFRKTFEDIMIFYMWLSKKTGFWTTGDTEANLTAKKAIQSLVTHICNNFTRKSSQGWNLSKMHELLHYPKHIHWYGSPLNYDSSACERMHKDTSKKPGRLSQKNHATFTSQAAHRLSQRLVIDHAYNALFPQQDSDVSTTIPTMKPSNYVVSNGSSFALDISTDEDKNGEMFIQVKIVATSHAMEKYKLDDCLYPNLAEFVVAYFSDQEDMPSRISCATEFLDEEGSFYRCHHNYRMNKFWHDWCLVSFKKEGDSDQCASVPCKILSFIPSLEFPDGRQQEANLVVCHPCNWGYAQVGSLAKRWNLLSCAQATYNGIPYEVVPLSSIVSHCMIVPDLKQTGVVYEIENCLEWSNYFY